MEKHSQMKVINWTVYLQKHIRKVIPILYYDYNSCSRINIKILLKFVLAVIFLCTDKKILSFCGNLICIFLISFKIPLKIFSHFWDNQNIWFFTQKLITKPRNPFPPSEFSISVKKLMFLSLKSPWLSTLASCSADLYSWVCLLEYLNPLKPIFQSSGCMSNVRSLEY